MTVEIRACHDREELEAYGEVVAYSFAINEAEDLRRELDATEPGWTTCAFVDGKLVTTLGAIPFDVQLNGATVPMGGVTAVGTLPEARRQGLLRQVMVQALRTMKEREQPFAILWASMGAIYQRFGYGLASPLISYRFDPRDVALLPSYASGGSCSLVPEANKLAIARDIYTRFATPRNLLIQRNRFLWEHETLRKKQGKAPYVAAYRNASGDYTGYVAYRTSEERHESDGPPQVLQVVDLAWLDLDALAGLWNYLRSHDLVSNVRMRAVMGEDDPIPAMLLEPRALNKTVGDGIWMRIVDVATGLSARPYSADGRLAIHVQDDLLEWNRGTWLLSIERGAATITRTDSPPDLVMPIATLATLVSGHRSATACRLAGQLSASSEAAIRLANAMFATNFAPYTPNEF
jgi:predicted acetyltransferase